MENKHIINEAIKAKKVLLLGTEGEKIGEYTLGDALKATSNQDLDLMQVGENGDIAICKAVNYSSWLYHENKKKQKQNFKNRSHETKQIQFKPAIGLHDYELKIKKMESFLNNQHKVKVVIIYKSREKNVEELIKKITESIKEFGDFDSSINRGVKEINFIVKPIKKNQLKNKV